MSKDFKKDGQPILFPEDENTVEVVEEEAAEGASGGGTGGVKQFSALPPLPDGDEVPIAMYAERAYLEYAISVVKGRALPTSATAKNRCSAAYFLQCARWV